MTHDEFEISIMNKFFEGDIGNLIELKKQYSTSYIKSREFTGWGFFTTFEVPDYLAVGNLHGESLDVVALIKGSKEIYGFRLVIDAGKLDYLEGFAMLDDWDMANYDLAVLEFNRADGGSDLKELKGVCF